MACHMAVLGALLAALVSSAEAFRLRRGSVVATGRSEKVFSGSEAGGEDPEEEAPETVGGEMMEGERMNLTRKTARSRVQTELETVPAVVGKALPKIITLVRHGEGYHNVNYNYDILDPSLTPKGTWQAENVQGEPELEDIELLVVSPLARAIETAAVIWGDSPKVPTFLQPLCAERAGAPCDVGTEKSGLVQRFPFITKWGGWEELPESWMHSKASDHDWKNQRIPAFVEWLRTRPEIRIAVVGHGGFFGGLIEYFTDDEYSMGNCELLTFEI